MLKDLVIPLIGKKEDPPVPPSGGGFSVVYCPPIVRSTTSGVRTVPFNFQCAPGDLIVFSVSTEGSVTVTDFTLTDQNSTFTSSTEIVTYLFTKIATGTEGAEIEYDASGTVMIGYFVVRGVSYFDSSIYTNTTLAANETVTTDPLNVPEDFLKVVLQYSTNTNMANSLVLHEDNFFSQGYGDVLHSAQKRLSISFTEKPANVAEDTTVTNRGASLTASNGYSVQQYIFTKNA
jgi:hypothetical protein